MAVAVTNCRRDSFRDICSLHAEQLAVFVSCASSGCAEKRARKPIEIASQKIRAELIARNTASLN
jgi:hypothetical protein